MNWIDVIILILIAIPTFLGWRNGVLRLVSTLVGGGVGFVLAGQYFKDLAPAIPVGDSEGIQQLIAFGVIVIFVLTAAWMAAKLLKTLLSVLFLGWVDSVAGAAIGLVLGAFTATVFISAAGIVPSNSVKEAVAESSLSEPLSDNLGFVRSLLPDEFNAVEDLLKTGKGLLDQGTGLLEQGQQLQETIQQGQDLLNQPQ
jgi:uncharacterized membrane protein required for colicin V production